MLNKYNLARLINNIFSYYTRPKLLITPTQLPYLLKALLTLREAY